MVAVPARMCPRGGPSAWNRAPGDATAPSSGCRRRGGVCAASWARDVMMGVNTNASPADPPTKVPRQRRAGMAAPHSVSTGKVSLDRPRRKNWSEYGCGQASGRGTFTRAVPGSGSSWPRASGCNVDSLPGFRERGEVAVDHTSVGSDGGGDVGGGLGGDATGDVGGDVGGDGGDVGGGDVGDNISAAAGSARAVQGWCCAVNSDVGCDAKAR